MATYLCQSCGTEQAQWTGACAQCGKTTPLQLTDVVDPFAGKEINGQYRVLKKLGQGGMGVVYLAEEMGMGQKIALKFLNAQLSSDAGVVRRFLNEAKSYARLNHPNAVTFHGFGQDAREGVLYIAMEYVEGQDLKTVLEQRKRLPLGEALDIALHVADVLSYAHEHGVIHKDLKPENIMLRKGMRGVHVKVLDFGIARLVEDGVTRLTNQLGVAGTPRYMSPEQILGEEVDARSDVYALGINLYEWLSGAAPFDGKNVNEILEQQMRRPLPPLPAVGFDDLHAVDAVLQRACAKDRTARYASMAEMARALGLLPPSTQRVVSLDQEGGTTPKGTLVLEKTAPTTADPREPSKAPLVGEQPPPAPSRLKWAALALLPLVAGGAFLALRHVPAPPPGVPERIDPGEQTDVVPREHRGPRERVRERIAERAHERTESHEQTDSQAELRKRLLSEEIWVKANAEAQAGNLPAAQAILDTLPAEQAAAPNLVALKASVAEMKKVWARAQGLAARGDCENAIRLYDVLLKAFPGLERARHERDACARARPPLQVE